MSAVSALLQSAAAAGRRGVEETLLECTMRPKLAGGRIHTISALLVEMNAF